ncbi:Abi family protein [Hymenobacter monticola]|uniref:Abi family protein n=1 Tax=Hymenobacter monticola TaxID=1705399 RepID=A0ABY4BJD2_9BACT|nr:Abi family protein [Hymenobacter monticola]UOE36715.1 Abi family protein [Hymenobacter monticola]
MNYYTKQPQTSAALIQLLLSRGLLIPDHARAIKYLESIGYYRLSGYMYPLQVPGKLHHFVAGISFDDVVSMYKFDKRLRAIVMEYMERIEVALRAKLTNSYSAVHGFFWYADASLFSDKSTAAAILYGIQEDFKLPKDQFLRAFKNNYPGEPLPPSQMALETLSLGELARLYKALTTDPIKLQIASDFRVAASSLETWFVWLTNVRNVCAHHSRLWNRNMSALRPHMPSRKAYKFAVPMPDDANTNMYGVVALMHRLLKSFNPNNTFARQVEALIQLHGVDATLMGFPPAWQTAAVWHHE